jgi:hypothetical protein
MASFKSKAATGRKKKRTLNLRLKNPFEIGLRMMIISRYEEVLLHIDDEPNCQLTVLPQFRSYLLLNQILTKSDPFFVARILSLQARHFVYFCAVFAVVPGCAVASLGVSSAVLGPAGTKQSAFLFASYTLSALLVATPLTQRWGPTSAMTAGMALMCLYVTSFVVASAIVGQDPTAAEALDHRSQHLMSGVLCAGAILGGIGAGVLWTAAGVYLARAASAIATSDPLCGGQHQAVAVIVGDDTREGHGESAPASVSSRANRMAGWFAFVFLLEETLLEGLSTLLVRRFLWRWTAVFGFYASLAVTATGLMRWVQDYKPEHVEPPRNGDVQPINGRRTAHEIPSHTPVTHSASSVVWKACDKLTLALRQLVTDRKAKYLTGLPLAFGVTGGFFISYVSGQVVPVSLYQLGQTPMMGSVNGAMAESLDVGGEIGASEAWVGALTAIHGLVAAVSSLLLGYCVNQEGGARQVDESSETDPYGSNGQGRGVLGRHSVSAKSIAVLVGGCVILAGTGLAFLMWPEPGQWNLVSLVGLYALHGVARAAYEGTVKAVHANLYGGGGGSSSCHSSATEGAFALVVLFHGIGSVTSYVMALQWHCETHDPGCVVYRDGSRHNANGFAWTVVVISVGAAVGYVRAWFLIQREEQAADRSRTVDLEDIDESSVSPFWRGVRSYQTVTSADDAIETELRELT